MKKLGIIICDRWRRCAGGKCLRALKEREGAFSRYRDDEVELVGYHLQRLSRRQRRVRAGGNEKNGADVVHLATGLLVGYPPCPYIDDFQKFIEEKYGMEVVLGTHPIPQNYFETHDALET